MSDTSSLQDYQQDSDEAFDFTPAPLHALPTPHSPPSILKPPPKHPVTPTTAADSWAPSVAAEEETLGNTWTRVGALNVEEDESGTPSVTSPTDPSLTPPKRRSGSREEPPSDTYYSTPRGSITSPGGSPQSQRGSGRRSFMDAARIVKTGSSVSFATVKRKKSAINIHLAAEEAKQQLQLEGVALSNEAMHEQELDEHVSQLRGSGNKSRAAGVAAEREESELYQTVNKLVADANQNRARIKELTHKKNDAERKEKDAVDRLDESQDEVAALKLQMSALKLQLNDSKVQNDTLRVEISQHHSSSSSSKLIIQSPNSLKKKGSVRYVTGVAMTLSQKYETKLRLHIETYEKEFRELLTCYKHNSTTSLLNTYTELISLKEHKEMQQEQIERMHGSVQRLETELVASKKARDVARIAARASKEGEDAAREQEMEAKAAYKLACSRESSAREGLTKAQSNEAKARAAALSAVTSAANAKKELENHRQTSVAAFDDGASTAPPPSPPPGAAYPSSNATHSNYSGRRGSSVTNRSNRSLSPGVTSVRGVKEIVVPPGLAPWYPAGSGANFHAGAVIRAKSPKLLATPLRDSASVGRSRSTGTSSSMSPTRPSPRRYVPQATPPRPRTPNTGNNGSTTRGRSPGSVRTNGSHSYQSHASPPRALVQHLSDLLGELKEWEEQQ